VIVVLAGLSILILVLSEIIAVAPAGRVRRLRIASLWCAVPLLALFAVTWFVQIRGVLDAAP
jgi:hypothetical protein